MSSPTDPLAKALADRVIEVLEERGIIVGKPTGEGTQWLTMKQAAEKTGIDYSTIAAAVRDGEIPCYTPLGRKRLDAIELDEWVRSHREVRISI